MGTLTHKAARAAYGTAIDAVLKHVKKDREKGLLELVDLTEKYMGDNFQKENYEATRKMIQAVSYTHLRAHETSLHLVCRLLLVLLYTSVPVSYTHLTLPTNREV